MNFVSVQGIADITWKGGTMRVEISEQFILTIKCVLFDKNQSWTLHLLEHEEYYYVDIDVIRKIVELWAE